MAGTPGNAIDISTTGVVYFNASVFQSIAPGATGTVLTSTGATAPTWQALPGSLTLAPIGSTPNANGGTISGTTLTLQPAGTSFGGLVSSTTQSFSGVKTFNSNPILPALTGVVTSDGGSGLTASAITQYGTLVAGPTNSIVSVSPSTSGFVLTSNGASANPSFQANSAISGIVTLTTDSGSATGNSVQITAKPNNGTSSFTATGSVVSLKFSDTNDNTILGLNSGSGGTSSFNSGLGQNSLAALASGSGANTALGAHSLLFLQTGDYNLSAGYNSGGNYTTSESSNISINNPGTATENNTLRIGAATGTGTQELSQAFISGINGVTSSSPAIVTTNTSSDQMGTMPYVLNGTFTPTLFGATTAGTTTYSFQNGYYTRIGNMLFVQVYVNISAATGTGQMLIGGLPVSINSQPSNFPVGSIFFHAQPAWVWPTSTTCLSVVGSYNGSDTQCSVWAQGSGVSGGFIQMANATLDLSFTLVYTA